MAILSMRARRKLWNYGMTAVIATSALVLQTVVLNNFPVKDVYCNLPLTLVIVWGAVFGSPMPPIRPDELRLSTFSQIFFRQLMTGSWSGAIVGFLMAAFYAPLLPVFPIYLPIAGWVAGYFCLRNMNQQNLLCIPLVFVITLLAETTMAWQLHFELHRAGVFDQLYRIALTEAILNAVVAPFIYFPMRRWSDFTQTVRVVREP